MPLRILLIPDKFKGTLSAGAAARAIAKGWHKARRQDSLDLLPMTDGGDGFGEVMSVLLCARIQRLGTVDAAHRPCSARWWWEPRTKTAIIESAAIVGLAMLPPGRFHPFELDTFGLGAVLRAAAAKGARRCLMGIGGSATNDGGERDSGPSGDFLAQRLRGEKERIVDRQRRGGSGHAAVGIADDRTIACRVRIRNARNGQGAAGGARNVAAIGER